jgi:hypothetical protein
MNANFCKYLRTKKMYVPAQEHEVFATTGEESGCGHCWCNRTMTEVGPDDRPVGPELCSSSGRSCFEK